LSSRKGSAVAVAVAPIPPLSPKSPVEAVAFALFRPKSRVKQNNFLLYAKRFIPNHLHHKKNGAIITSTLLSY
jgi:hypothetical protein